MWLNRLFINLANQDEKTCLTIDCSGNNKNGPGRYRTQAGNPEKQVCYFIEPRNDQVYNIFISERIKSGNFEKGIIVKLIMLKARRRANHLV